jgi:hypothetical protein
MYERVNGEMGNKIDGIYHTTAIHFHRNQRPVTPLERGSAYFDTETGATLSALIISFLCGSRSSPRTAKVLLIRNTWLLQEDLPTCKTQTKLAQQLGSQCATILNHSHRGVRAHDGEPGTLLLVRQSRNLGRIDPGDLGGG